MRSPLCLYSNVVAEVAAHVEATSGWLISEPMLHDLSILDPQPASIAPLTFTDRELPSEWENDVPMREILRDRLMTQ